MKKIMCHKVLLAVWAVATAMLAACSSSGSDLYSLASADAAVVMTGNIESVLENADCAATSSGIQLSAPLQKLVSVLSPRDRRDATAMLDIKGIDLKHTLMAIDKNNELVFAFKLSNASDFKQFVNKSSGGNLQPTKDGEYECYRFEPNTALFLVDDMAILLHSEQTTVDSKHLEQYMANAKSRPLEKWQLSALDEGKTLNMLASIPTINDIIQENTGVNMLKSGEVAKLYDLDQLSRGYFAICCSLHDLDLDIECTVVDNKGKTIPTKLADSTPTINTSLLKYASSQDYLVAMGAMPQSIDWNSALYDIVDMMGGQGVTGIDGMTISILGMLLNDLTGTVMLAAGPQSTENIEHLYGWHAVVAAEMKDGKAEQYIDMIKTFIDANNQDAERRAAEYRNYGWDSYEPMLIKTEYVDGELQITIPYEGTVYAKAMDNTFVASLSPISKKGGCKISSSEFKNALAGVVVDVPKNNAFSTVLDFPFGCNVSYISDAKGVRLRASQTDTDGRFLNNLFALIAGQ